MTDLADCALGLSGRRSSAAPAVRRHRRVGTFCLPAEREYVLTAARVAQGGAPGVAPELPQRSGAGRHLEIKTRNGLRYARLMINAKTQKNAALRSRRDNAESRSSITSGHRNDPRERAPDDSRAIPRCTNTTLKSVSVRRRRGPRSWLALDQNRPVGIAGG